MLESLVPPKKEALDAGDALQIREYLLDLHEPFFEAGHGEDRQLITRIYRQDRQKPPAASWSIRCRLKNKKHFKILDFTTKYLLHIRNGLLRLSYRDANLMLFTMSSIY